MPYWEAVLYSAFLIEGNDIGGIDIGFLVQESSVQVDDVTQLGKDETFIDPRDGSEVILHDRPPLLLEGSFIVNSLPVFPVKVMGLHNRSLNNIEGIYAQTKRLEQAQSIAEKVQALQDADPDVKRDILYKLNKEIPQRENYHHGEGNSDAHIKSSLFGPTLQLIIKDGQLLLGTWQGILFCEFDGPRSRRLYLKIVSD